MPGKTNGQKQQLASTQKDKEATAAKLKEQREKREQERANKEKEKALALAAKVKEASYAKDADAVLRLSFEFPSKRKPAMTRDGSPSKATKGADEPRPDIELVMATQGSSSSEPAQTNVPGKKGDDSDFDEYEDEDEDEDAVAVVKLPPAKMQQEKQKRIERDKSSPPRHKVNLNFISLTLPYSSTILVQTT
jgi:hypothetical protein